eukprot:gene9979-biopygen18258
MFGSQWEQGPWEFRPSRRSRAHDPGAQMRPTVSNDSPVITSGFFVTDIQGQDDVRGLPGVGNCGTTEGFGCARAQKAVELARRPQSAQGAAAAALPAVPRPFAFLFGVS